MKNVPILMVVLLMVATTMADFSKRTTDRPHDYGWLEGSWIGDGFGGTSEEIWSAPSSDGTMMGVFRHHTASGELNFYEFMVLDSLGLHIKHFSPNLSGWEEKDDYLTFSMLHHDSTTITLKGVFFKLLSQERMEIHLKMKDSTEQFRTEVFHMRRRK